MEEERQLLPVQRRGGGWLFGVVGEGGGAYILATEQFNEPHLGFWFGSRGYKVYIYCRCTYTCTCSKKKKNACF